MTYDPTTLDEVVEVNGKRLVRCPKCSHGHWHTEQCRGCSGQAQREYDAPRPAPMIAQQLHVKLPTGFGSVAPAPRPPRPTRPTMRLMSQCTKSELVEVAIKHCEDERMALSIVEYYMTHASIRTCRINTGINQRYIGKVYKQLDWHRSRNNV